MSIRSMIAALALAISLPFAASAATLESGKTYDLFPDGVFTFSLPTLGPNEPGATLEFTFRNNEDSAAAVTIATGTILQDVETQGVPGFGFTNGVQWSFGSASGSTAAGQRFDFKMITTLQAGQSETLKLTYGTTYGTGADIDLTVRAAVVPVPAAGFLLLGGLGGLIALKRRKTA